METYTNEQSDQFARTTPNAFSPGIFGIDSYLDSAIV